MSFSTTIKRVFGFSVEDDEEYEIHDSTLENAEDDLSAQGIVNPFRQHQVTTGQQETAAPPPTSDENVPEAQDIDTRPVHTRLFDSVVRTLNEQMPEIVSRCMSTEKQRQYLIESIDEELREEIDNLVRQRPNAPGWEKERKALLEEIDRVKAGAKGVDDIKKEYKAAQLSSERQKRALSDRANDLERRLAQADAEREQLQLENQALISKFRAAGIIPDNVEVPGEDHRLAEKDATIAAKDAEIARLNDNIEQLKTKNRLADAMFNDLTAQAAQAKQELREAQESLSALDEINSRLDEFESVKKKKDARISELASQLKEAQTRALSAENEIISLKKTIEANLYNQADSEKELHDEIARLKSQLSEKETHPDITKKRKGRTRVSVIDESLDNTDWLVAPTSSPATTKDDAPKDDDFGYKEPPRNKIPDNDRQMSLW